MLVSRVLVFVLLLKGGELGHLGHHRVGILGVWVGSWFWSSATRSWRKASWPRVWLDAVEAVVAVVAGGWRCRSFLFAWASPWSLVEA